MCGRYTLSPSPDEIAAAMEAMAVKFFNYQPAQRFNVSPTQTVPVITQDAKGQRSLDGFRWGFIPSWAKDIGGRPPVINARADTIAESLVTKKGMFRSAFKSRRCLIPADGFYEWKKLGKGTQSKVTQPMRFKMKDERIFTFAGLWEEWHGPDGPLRSCTIITTEPNELVAPVHNRMPVILPEDLRDEWLATDLEDDELLRLLQPYQGSELESYPVAKGVGSPHNDLPEMIERIEIEHTEPINSK